MKTSKKLEISVAFCGCQLISRYNCTN